MSSLLLPGVEFGCYILGIALDLFALSRLAGRYDQNGLLAAENSSSFIHWIPTTRLTFHEIFGEAPDLGLEHRNQSFQACDQTACRFLGAGAFGPRPELHPRKRLFLVHSQIGLRRRFSKPSQLSSTSISSTAPNASF